MTPTYMKYATVRLLCERDHVHLMSPEQAQRLEGEPCCWCGTPTYIVALLSGFESEPGQSRGRPRTRERTTTMAKAVACMTVHELAQHAVSPDAQDYATRALILGRLFYLHRVRLAWQTAERRAAA